MNRMLNFLAQRLPVIIIWQLWVHFNQCRYGKERPSGLRVIHNVTREIVDCIRRKWPEWDPFPPNWNFIIKRAEGFRCQKIVRTSRWCKPPRGWIKINIAKERGSCSFIIRNAEGEFVLVGVSTGEGNIIHEVMYDLGGWCKRRGLVRVQMEMDVDIEGEGMNDLTVEWRKCERKVNCVAHWLLNACEGQNVFFRRAGALPKGFLQILSLEGYPHFSSFPGCDYVPLVVNQNRAWDPGGV